MEQTALPFIESINKKCDQLGFQKNYVEFLGAKNIKEVYKRSDFLILLSNYEALPLTIIEALTHGIPCVASDLGGVDELIVNKFNGLIVNEIFNIKVWRLS